MSAIARNALRMKKSLIAPAKLAGGVQQSARTLWVSAGTGYPATPSRLPLQQQQQASSSCCSSSALFLFDKSHGRALLNRPRLGCCSFSTNAEKELVEFLAEEIVAEKNALKTIPTEVEGYKVSLDGADVTLTKTQDDEKIILSFNINHTIDLTEEPELNPKDDEPDIGEMKSKPDFNVDIKRGNQTLSFQCSFNDEPGASGENDEYNDIFGIDEVSFYEGEYSDKVYLVSGNIIDGYLYDLLMNYLEEKGISNELAEKICELSTNYEHTAYIGLLEGLAKFTKK